MIPEAEVSNFQILLDCLQSAIIPKLVLNTAAKSTKRRGKGRKNGTYPLVAPASDAEPSAAEFSEFVEYLAEEVFENLPAELRTLSYAVIQNHVTAAERYSTPLDAAVLDDIVKPLPLSIADSLSSYGLTNDTSDMERFLEVPLNNYVQTTTSAPPEHNPSDTQSRPDACEICSRTQLPLTYHHLIPRGVHDKAVKRGWHAEWELNKVAWLCRACHSFVHKIATNEELAKSLYTVDSLLEREDVQRWAAWVGRIRWKAR